MRLIELESFFNKKVRSPGPHLTFSLLTASHPYEGFDGIMAVGNAYEPLAHMSWFYSEMGLQGASFALEVLLKTNIVSPQNIKFLKDSD